MVESNGVWEHLNPGVYLSEVDKLCATLEREIGPRASLRHLVTEYCFLNRGGKTDLSWPAWVRKELNPPAALPIVPNNVLRLIKPEAVSFFCENNPRFSSSCARFIQEVRLKDDGDPKTYAFQQAVILNFQKKLPRPWVMVVEPELPGRRREIPDGVIALRAILAGLLRSKTGSGVLTKPSDILVWGVASQNCLRLQPSKEAIVQAETIAISAARAMQLGETPKAQAQLDYAKKNLFRLANLCQGCWSEVFNQMVAAAKRQPQFVLYPN